MMNLKLPTQADRVCNRLAEKHAAAAAADPARRRPQLTQILQSLVLAGTRSPVLPQHRPFDLVRTFISSTQTTAFHATNYTKTHAQNFN
jgi:hypothetical protein